MRKKTCPCPQIKNRNSKYFVKKQTHKNGNAPSELIFKKYKSLRIQSLSSRPSTKLFSQVSSCLQVFSIFFVFRLHATASSLVNCCSGYFLAFQHSTLNIINVSHQTLKLGLDFEFSFMDLFFNESLKYDYLFVINYKLILCLHRWQVYPWQPPDFQADIR